MDEGINKFLLLFFVALTTLQQVSTHTIDSSPGDDGNPCHEVYENTTIDTPQGKIICMVPSEEELTEQLKSVGGYNKHYVARTQQEVNENFNNLLPWDGAATTQKGGQGGHPSFKSKRLSKRTTLESKEKRRIPMVHRVSKRSKHPSGIVSSTKTGCISKGQEVGRQRLKQMCDICQRSSELDIDRFPRFMNELTCETANGSPSNSGNSCYYHNFALGTCIQSTMTIDLLRRTDKYTVVSPPSGDYFKAYKQIWVPYTQEIRSCCQCRY